MDKKKQKKNKSLEITILFIIILSIALIYFLASSYLKSTENIGVSESVNNFSVNKIHKYPNVLNDIKNYNIPYKRYVDARTSNYTIYIKSTDNIITGITEIINIDYFDTSSYSIEDIDFINKMAMGINDDTNTETSTNETNQIPEDNPDNQTINNVESPNDNQTENNPTDNKEISNEETTNNQTPTTDEVENKSTYPPNWLDIYSYEIEEFNQDKLTNFCNSYNETEATYSLTCTQKDTHLTFKNNYNVSNFNSYILKTKNFEIILPMKKSTKLTDYIKDLNNQDIKVEQTDKIE